MTKHLAAAIAEGRGLASSAGFGLFAGHPHPDLAAGKRLLVVEWWINGEANHGVNAGGAARGPVAPT